MMTDGTTWASQLTYLLHCWLLTSQARQAGNTVWWRWWRQQSRHWLMSHGTPWRQLYRWEVRQHHSRRSVSQQYTVHNVSSARYISPRSRNFPREATGHSRNISTSWETISLSSGSPSHVYFVVSQKKVIIKRKRSLWQINAVRG